MITVITPTWLFWLLVTCLAAWGANQVYGTWTIRKFERAMGAILEAQAKDLKERLDIMLAGEKELSDKRVEETTKCP